MNQMEEAVTEARELLARHDAGTLEPDLEPEERSGFRVSLERLLRDREAWLRGEVIKAGVAQNVDSQAALSLFRSVEYRAEMLTKAEAIAWLRTANSLNHEPLRPIEQQWLDRIFICERMSKGWIERASVIATTEETGVHTEDGFGPAPCRCPDSFQRKEQMERH